MGPTSLGCVDELVSRAEPESPEVAHAIALADEFGMSVVLVRLRVEAEPETARALLAEAELEVAEMLLAEEWPLWERELADTAGYLVLDGAPRSIKRALVQLEDDHDLGEAWNLDLVTLMDGGPDVWHASPDRPERRGRPAIEAHELTAGYGWSEGNPAVSR